MDLSKFLRLLQTRSLWFAQGDLLGDPFEGASTVPQHVQLQTIYQDLPNPTKIVEDISRINRRLPKAFQISCWHANDYESAAMWNLYSNSGDSICIQTTYRILFENLPSVALIGTVKYIDYNTEWYPGGNMYYRMLHKRKSLEHEREVRAIITRWSVLLGKTEESTDIEAKEKEQIGPWIQINGLAVPIDLARMIQAVYIHPRSAAFLKAVVSDTMEKYGLSAPVLRSSLEDAALF